MAVLSFDEFVKQAGGKPTDVKTVEPQVTAPQEQPGYLSRIKQDFTTRAKGVQEAKARQAAGEQKGVETFGQTAGQAVGFLTDVVTETPGVKQALESTGKGIKTLSETSVIKKLGEMASPLAEKILTHYETASPREKANIEAALNIASVVPISKAGELGVRAGKAGLETAEKGLGAISATGKITTKGGEKLYGTAFDLTADEARLVQGNKINVAFLEKERAKLPKDSKEYKTLTDQIEANKLPITRATTALEKGIAGTEKQVGVKAGVEKMDIWKNKLEPALKASKDTMTKDELLAGARDRVAKEIEPSRKARLQTALEALEEDYANFAGGDLLTMNKIKTGLDTFTPSKIFKGQEVASETKMLQADMANAIRQKTYMSLKDINAKRAYIDYGNLKQLEKVGIKALTEAGTKGGFGGFWSTIYDAATVPVKTVGGKVLYRVGNKLEFLGEKGVKTLRQHLESKGIKIKQP